MTALTRPLFAALAMWACLVPIRDARAQAQPGPASSAPRQAQVPTDDDVVQRLLARLETIVQSGDLISYLDLVSGATNRTRAIDFAQSEIVPGATRAVIRERDRVPFGSSLTPGGYRLVVDVFVEFGSRARVASWQLDVQKTAGGLQIVGAERLTSVENLYRIALDATKQFAATHLTLKAEDLEVTLESGSVFLAPTEVGVTAMVLLGRGEMRFHPKPETERGQVRIFCGSETLVARFDSAFLRLDPSDFNELVASDALAVRTVDARDARKAGELFAEDSVKSFQIGLGDLSADMWSLLPGRGNFLGEIHTRRFGTLTYTRSRSDAEDITLFDRTRRRNISVYASEETLARRGQSYSDDDNRDYDVVDYNIDLAYSPLRQFLDGVASVRMRVRSSSLSTISLRLSDALVVRSITSDRFGRLFGFRVNRQNVVVINLPAALIQDTLLTLTFVYSGRLEAQTPDGNEAVGVAAAGQDPSFEVQPEFAAEPSYLYSNRNAWYPQATSTDYATATLKISVPPSYDCVASGVLQPGSPQLAGSKEDQSERKTYTFSAEQPLRYLAFIVSKFIRSETVTVPFPHGNLAISVEANPRQAKRSAAFADRAAEIIRFYASLTADVPYPAFTLAIVEGELPGGHSPAYFAQLFQPLPMAVLTWRGDPAAFDRFPDFFLAHELAHQWWGQAVGWRNYHEQWISEGFAQYFAALFAQQQRGDAVFAGVMRQMRRWAMNESDQGPIYLGYRLGHIKGDGRIFRALVYNKSASVLHMLRRMVGDEAFFEGLRQFYATSRFQKAGTDDFKRAVEAAAGRPLDRFFDQWILGSTLPRLKVTSRVDGAELVVHIEQLGEVFDVPVTMTVRYADRKKADIVIPVTEQITDRRLPLSGAVQEVEVNSDDGTLAEFVK
jgi:Peptidase family M1 domain